MPKITKDEAARILNKTLRAVERYAAAGRLSVTYEKGKTRDVPVYDHAEVERLVDELRQPSTPARGVVATPADNGDAGVSQAVAIHSPQGLQRAGSPESIAVLGQAIADALRATQDGKGSGSVAIADLALKMTLSFKEAALLSGVPESHLREGYARGVLRGAKIGRGVRVTPDDVQKYVEQRMKGKR